MLYSFFGGLLGTSLAVTVVICLFFCFRRKFEKRYTARWRCLLWMVAALRLLVPLAPALPHVPAPRVIPVSLPLEAVPTVQAEQSLHAKERAEIGPAAREVPADQIGERLNWVSFDWVAARALNPRKLLVAGAWLWLAGAEILAVWQLMSRLRFRRRMRRWSTQPGDMGLQDRLDRVCASLGISRSIPLRLMEGVWSPVLAGIFRPMVLLPQADYTDCELEAIFRHEAVHYLRGDVWKKLLLSAACTLHWFNPMVWLMAREAGREIEAACDARATADKSAEQRRQYGRAILSTLERQAAGRFPGTEAVAFASGKRAMARRLACLFDRRPKKRGVAALLLAAAVVVLSASLTACEWSFDGVKQTNEELVIWTNKAQNQYLTNFEMFQAMHPEIKVVVEDYFQKEVSIDEYMQKLTTEVNAGKGPDVIFLDHTFQRASSVEKMMRGGVFADMTEFFGADFQWEDYHQEVMNAGVVDGKRYVFPLQYTLPVTLASKDELDGFDLSRCTDFPSYLEESGRWLERSGGDRRFFTHSRVLAPYFTGIGGISCIDYDAGTADLNDPALRRAVEAYKTLYLQEQSSPMDEGNGLEEWPLVGDEQRLFAVYFRENYMLPFRYDLCRDLSYLRVHGGSVLMPMRNVRGKLSVHIKEAVAVRANSANKKNAALLIEYLLSDQVQSGQYRSYYPVREESLNKQLEAAKSVANMYVENSGMTVEESQGITDGEAAHLLDLTRQVDSAYFRSRYDKEFYDGFRPYWEGKKSYGDCAAELESWFGIVATE